MNFNDGLSMTSKIKGSITTSEENNLLENLTIGVSKSKASNFYGNCRSESSGKNAKSEDSSSSNEDLPLDKDIIFCNKSECKGPYYIIFLDTLDLSFDCGCSLQKNLTMKEHKKEYEKDYLFKKEKNENTINKDLLHCKKHPKETQFFYYFTDCYYDLCKECLNENSKLYTNTSKIYKTHENHTLINLGDIIQKFPNIEKSIEKYKDLENNSRKRFFRYIINKYNA